MANPLYQRFGGQMRPQPNNNLISQLIALRKDPGGILDILLQNGKITQQQYAELQPYRNNPQSIFQYLANHGKSGELNQAEQTANSLGVK